MKNFFDQIRMELTQSSDRVPFLTLVLAALVTLTPIALLGSGIADVVISSAAALFLLRSAVERDFSWTREPWIIVAFVLWIYLIARGVLSVDPERSGLKALGWIRFIIFGAAIQFVLMRSVTARKALLYSFLVMAVFGAADALFQYVVGHDIFGRPKIGNRLTGPLRNQAIGTLVSVVGLPALFYLYRRLISALRERSFDWLSAAALVMIYAAVILSGERLSLLISIALTGVVLVVLTRSLVLPAIGVALYVAFIGSLVLSAPELRQRQLSTVTEIGSGTGSIYTRAMIAGIEVIENHTIFGVGVKNFQAHCPASATPDEVGDACRLIHPHQVWLQITAETGLVGAAGFLTLFILALTPAVRSWRRWADDPLLAGATIAVLVRLFPFAPSGNFFSNWRESFFWLLLGTAAAMGRIAVAEKVDSTTPDRSPPQA